MTHFIGKFTSAVAYVRYSIILLTVGSGLKTSSLLCRRVLTPSIICLPLFVASRARWKTHFSFAVPFRRKTNFSFAGPARWQNHLSFEGQARQKIVFDGLGTGFGPESGPLHISSMYTSF